MEQIIITRKDGTKYPLAVKREATAIKEARQSWGLLGDDVVNISVESPYPQRYEIGDHFSVFGRTYKLNQLPDIQKSGAYKYTYRLKFEGVQYDLLRAIYDLSIETTGNTLQDVQGEQLTGDLNLFAKVLIANANRVFPGKWKLGECPQNTEVKTLTFGDGDNCLMVYQNLCKEFEVEADMTQKGDSYTINFYRRIGTTHPFVFEFGKGKGLYSLNRQNIDSSNIVTRLKVFGSDKNISNKYRANRLCLPNKRKSQSFIEAQEAIQKYGIHEARKVFDHIKPTFCGRVSAIVMGNVLQFRDERMFDLNAKEADNTTTKYLIAGVNAKIHFNTGKLAGYEFGINRYDHATKTFTINKLTDERGDVFPASNAPEFQIAVGDEYKILDVTLPEQYQIEAEQKLQEQGEEYYRQNSQPRVKYGLSIDKMYLKKLFAQSAITTLFAPGDYINIKDQGVGVDKAVRIQSLQRNLLDVYDYTLTLSDVAENNITTRVISELYELDKITTIHRLKDPNRAKANWQTSRELLDMVFDPDGDYYTEKIKPNSIDTLALSVGAKAMQFALQNVVFEPNYQGQKNDVRVSDGTLTHYTIEAKPRHWSIAQSIASLSEDQTPYYIFAKCNKADSSASIIFSKNPIKTEEISGYYHFWIGVVNSVDETLNARSIALSYGYSMINGRFISTGRIASADGQTYFDLDSGEIRGNIVFNANGETKNLQQLDNDLTKSVKELTKQISGKINLFAQDYPPHYDFAHSEEDEIKHDGDLWYNTEEKKLYRYTTAFIEGIYRGARWNELKNADAINAYQEALSAQQNANSKRRVFVQTPTPPYEIGDLWLDGNVLRRCQNNKVLEQPYELSDWVLGVAYDNTKTTIDGGLVTSGTIQVAGDNAQILAGITGTEEGDEAVRFWAGERFQRRGEAPFRVLQDGTTHMTKANVSGIIDAKSGKIGGFDIGTMRIGAVNNYDQTTGLSLNNTNIRFRSTGQVTQFASIGDLTWFGTRNAACFELTSKQGNFNGSALFVRCTAQDNQHEKLYTQRAIEYHGNLFGIGARAQFATGYIGEAYTSVIREWFHISNQFHITTTRGSQYLRVDLPTTEDVTRHAGRRPCIFNLQIVCDRLMHNVISIRASPNARIANNDGALIDFVDMERGDALELRYYDGVYHILNRQITT